MTKEQRPTAAEQIGGAMFQFAEVAGRAAAEWAERMHSAFEQLGEVASRPEIRAMIERAQAARTAHQSCHCLCGKAHPDDKGICDGEGVTTRHFNSPGIGPVDVPLCAPCAVAYGVRDMAQP